MLIKEIKELFIRDLERLKKELFLYETKSQIWVVDNEIANSAGNLILHLCGNLKHFVGATLNFTGYIRDRDKEFYDKNISCEQLEKNIDETIAVLKNYFDNIKNDSLDNPFPINVFNKQMTTRHMLIHLYGHLNYHLGQINYHRRMYDGNKNLSAYSEEVKQFLQPTEFINSDHPDILALTKSIVSEGESKQEKIKQLYLFVRDRWRYNPYKLDLRKEQMKASAILKRTEAYCIEKAILFAALLRAAGIPAKVGFANVVNHIGTEKLEEIFKTNVLVFHGYTLVYFKELWHIATPAFNKELCEKLNVDVLEFDGTKNSMLQQFSKQGNKYMEYVHDYGSFSDLPHELMLSELQKYYPHFMDVTERSHGEVIFRL